MFLAVTKKIHVGPIEFLPATFLITKLTNKLFGEFITQVKFGRLEFLIIFYGNFHITFISTLVLIICFIAKYEHK